jgi:hypothetical protein
MVYMSGLCAKLVTTATPVVIGSSTVTATPPFMAIDNPVMVAWVSSDLDLFTPASAPLLEDRATSSRNATTFSPGSQRKSNTTTSSGLSSGAKAGIAAGNICGLLVIVLLVLLLACVRKHHQQRKESETNHEALEGHLNQIEGDTVAIFEASAEPKPAEADFSNARVELDGDWYGYEVEGTAVLPPHIAG